MNWAASAAVGYGFSMLFTIHWQAKSSRGCLYSLLVSSSGGTTVATLNTAFNGARQLGKTSAKKYHHIPMFGVDSGPCKSRIVAVAKHHILGVAGQHSMSSSDNY